MPRQIREPAILVDGQPERPRADAEGHPVAGLADQDRPIPGKFRAAEDFAARDEQIALPREREARLDENLPAIRSSDAALGAAKLKAVDGETHRVGVGAFPRRRRRACRSRDGFSAKFSGSAGNLSALAGGSGESYWTICGTLPSSPLGGASPLAGHFDVDRIIPLARTVVEELKREPESFVGAAGGFAVLDGGVGGRLPSR